MQDPGERELLVRAVELALENGARGQRPFGALVVRGGEVLGTGVNTVLRDGDPTAHAEVAAVRDAARGGRDVSGATILTSCEPCPMCRAVAALAGVARIAYAAPGEAAARAGFTLSPAAAELQAAWPGSAALAVEHVPTPGAEEPFARWSAAPPGEEAAGSPVAELRVAVTVEDYEQALEFYRDVLGLPVVLAWDEPEGKGAVLGAGRGTLELLSESQAEHVDRVEVGERVTGPVRLALEVEDSARTAADLVAAGAELLGEPAETPWGDVNARVRAPDGLQLTLFTVPRGQPRD